MKKGKILYNSLIRSVLRVPFERRETDHIGRDGAFSGSSGISMNTTVYGGPGAEALAFYRAYNGALAAGVEPKGVSLSLLLPVAETEPAVKARMEAFKEVCDREEVRILGGHTAFSDAITRPVLTVAVLGEGGEAPAPIDLPGRSLILTKTAGAAGAGVLLSERTEVLKKRFSRAYLAEARNGAENLSCGPETAVFRQEGALLHDLSEGGLYSALYELSEGYKIGFFVDLQAVPVLQETVEICEALGGDPFSLLSTGCMLAAVHDGPGVLELLREAGISAEIIGELRAGREKVLKKGSEEGFLERPGPDLIMELEEFG